MIDKSVVEGPPGKAKLTGCKLFPAMYTIVLCCVCTVFVVSHGLAVSVVVFILLPIVVHFVCT